MYKQTAAFYEKNNPPNLAKTYPEKKKCHDVPEFVSRVPLLLIMLYYYYYTLKLFCLYSTYLYYFLVFSNVMCLFI